MGDVHSGEHIVPTGRKGSWDVNQLVHLSSYTCGRNCHLPRAVFYTWTSLCPNMQCFLAGTHLACSLNWSSEISWPGSSWEGVLSFSRWQAASGSPREETQEGCRGYCGWRGCCYLRESSSSRATPSITLLRPLQPSLSHVTMNLNLLAVLKSPPPICHTIIAASSVISNLRRPLQKQWLSSSPAPCSQRASRGESGLLAPTATLLHTAAREPFAGAGESTD